MTDLTRRAFAGLCAKAAFAAKCSFYGNTVGGTALFSFARHRSYSPGRSPPEFIRTVDGLFKDFITSDPMRIMGIYSNFYPTIISSDKSHLNTIEAYEDALLNSIETGILTDPLYKKQLHRICAVKFVYAAHRFGFSDKEQEYLSELIRSGLKHDDPTVSEILLQNLITSHSPSKNILRAVSDENGNISDNKHKIFLQVGDNIEYLLSLLPYYIEDEKYHSAINSLVVYLMNSARLFTYGNDIQRVTRIYEALLNASQKLPDRLSHIKHTIAIGLKPSSFPNLTLGDTIDIASLSPQPTECIFSWKVLIESRKISPDYITWLIIERLRFLYGIIERAKPFGPLREDSDIRIAKLVDLTRAFQWNGAPLSRFWNSGLDTLVDENFRHWLIKGLPNLINDTLTFPLASIPADMIAEYSRAPYGENKGRNTLAGLRSSATEEDLRLLKAERENYDRLTQKLETLSNYMLLAGGVSGVIYEELKKQPSDITKEDKNFIAEFDEYITSDEYNSIDNKKKDINIDYSNLRV